MVNSLKPLVLVVGIGLFTLGCGSADPDVGVLPDSDDSIAEVSSETSPPAKILDKPKLNPATDESGMPISISRSTTRIVKPLRDDDYPDYLAALDQQQSAGVTAANNYGVEALKVFGPRLINESIREEYFERLGIEVLPEDGDYLIEFRDFLEQEFPDNYEELKDRYYDRNFESRPWRSEDFRELAQWLQRYAKQIDRLAPTPRHTKYYTPLVSSSPNPSMVLVMAPTTITQFRDATRALRERAMLRLGSGDVDGAWEDVMACRRIANFSRQGPALVDALIANALDSISYTAIVTISGDPRLTKEQVSRFRKELGDGPDQTSILAFVEPGERYICLDAICAIVRDGPKGLNGLAWVAGGGADEMFEMVMESVIKESSGAEVAEAVQEKLRQDLTPDEKRQQQLQILYDLIDWNFVLKTCNEFYDRVQEIAQLDDARQRDSQLKSLLDETEALGDFESLAHLPRRVPTEQRQEFSRQLAANILELFSGGIAASVRSQQRTDTEGRLAEVALALAAWRVDHGDYADRLEMLTPDYLNELPLDAFSDSPLRYTRRDSGYQLYSIGFNQEDEDGSGPYNDGEGDDVVVAVGGEDSR